MTYSPETPGALPPEQVPEAVPDTSPVITPNEGIPSDLEEEVPAQPLAEQNQSQVQAQEAGIPTSPDNVAQDLPSNPDSSGLAETVPGPTESVETQGGDADPVEAELTIKEPVDLEDLNTKPLEEIEQPNVPLDLSSQDEKVDASLVEIESQIAEARRLVELANQRMEAVRSELGAPGSGENTVSVDQGRLEQLLAREAMLKRQKEEIAYMKMLQEAMDILDGYTPEERRYIIANGTMPDGKPLTLKDGREITPDVAKDLAQSVENGVKKVTKAILKVVLGAVKGVIKGILSAVAEVAGM